MSFNSELLGPEIMREHRAIWYVWAGDEKIRHTARMRGSWGYDVVCSCGQFESKVGGGVKSYVEELLFDHRFSAKCDKERAEEAKA